MTLSVFDALDRQHADLAGILDSLESSRWSTPTRCEGWDVADVVLHLAQTDEFVVAGCNGTGEEAMASFIPSGESVESVDDAAELAVRRERGVPADDLLARWRAAADESRRLLRERPAEHRVPWVLGTLPPKTLATTRLSEAWIHTGDIAEAVGGSSVADDRLWHIARLAWRTLPYAFGLAGSELSGPVALRLTSPAGEKWIFGEEEGPATTVTGPALEWCLLAARRRPAELTSLRAEGADGSAVLSLARTYA
ncbi:MAG TPA: maleylpyruvate isomerase family mycothiol-dependent enzyme [Acidimicrobiales bacterium]|nr:maleylpyruvate isomerase family mycothiol-dependent enzyme [Acidimicrobiales bacterium]